MSHPTPSPHPQATPVASDHEARRDPWGTVVLLLFVAVLNYIDRLLPGVLAEPIRQDLNLSDTALGIINGFGFLLVYAVAGIAISRFADRGMFAPVIAISLGLWSLTTAIGSLAQNGWQLGASRLGVAVGEAGSLPAAQAFIAASFSPGNRGRALSLLSLGSVLGTLLSLTGGGLMAEWIGWRMTFAAMGLLGLLFAPIVYIWMRRIPLLPVPVIPAGNRGKWTDLFRTRSAILIVIAGGLIATGGYTGSAFNAAFLMRVHGLSVADLGLQLGLASGLAGIIGLGAAGWAADKLSQSSPRWTIAVLAITMAMATPITLFAYLTSSSEIAIIAIAAGSACTHVYLPLTIVALYRLVPSHLRARTSATFLFVTAMLGGAGPLIAGMISDSMAPAYGTEALRYALMIIPMLGVISAILYMLASRAYLLDIERTSGSAG